MAYTRWNESGYYIFGGVDYVDFDGKPISDEMVDIFLYSLYSSERTDDNSEFWERYYHGSRVIDNFQKGVRVHKIYRHTGGLDSKAAAISALAGEIWREHYTPLIGEAQVAYILEKFQSPEQIAADIKSHDYTYFTAESVKTEELVGYCACQPREDHLFLSKIYVHSDHRGKGVSRSFLEKAIALCRREYGLDRIRLTVNKYNSTAITVYQKWGFTVADSVKTDIGEGFFMDDYIMELWLEPWQGGCNA